MSRFGRSSPVPHRKRFSGVGVTDRPLQGANFRKSRDNLPHLFDNKLIDQLACDHLSMDEQLEASVNALADCYQKLGPERPRATRPPLSRSRPGHNGGRTDRSVRRLRLQGIAANLRLALSLHRRIG